MVKPALPYLDVIRAVREAFDVPVCGLNVPGEYAMVKAAAQNGWLDERQAALESLIAIKRAGAQLILSYWTRDLPPRLSKTPFMMRFVAGGRCASQDGEGARAHRAGATTTQTASPRPPRPRRTSLK